MKKSILLTTLAICFFMGLSATAQTSDGNLISDEKALSLIRESRQAIGGENKISNIKALSIIGNRTYAVSQSSPSPVQRRLEMSLQLPDQFALRNLPVNNDKAAATSDQMEIYAEVMPGNKPNVSVKASKPIFRVDVFRIFFHLFASAPEGMNALYKYSGTEDVDGNSCEIIEAIINKTSTKLYLDKTTFLPVMMTYPDIILSIYTGSAMIESDSKQQRQARIKFSEFRDFEELKLPFRWEYSSSTSNSSRYDVISYDINPTNIEERLKN